LPVGAWLAAGQLGGPNTVVGPRATFWQRRLREQQAHTADHRLYLWSEIALRHSSILAQTAATSDRETIAA